MFRVRNTNTGEVWKVFDVRTNPKFGYVELLIYRDCRWVWVDGNCYEPYEN